jgi:hypothetical protein
VISGTRQRKPAAGADPRENTIRHAANLIGNPGNTMPGS